MTLVWKRNSKNSVVFGFCSLFKNLKDKNSFKITKTDSMNFSAARASSSSSIVKKCSFDFSHGAETQITKHVSLSTTAGAGYYATWNKAAVLSANVSISASIRF